MDELIGREVLATQRISVVWNFANEVANKVVQGWQAWRQTRLVRSFRDAWRWGIAAIIRPVPTLQRAADEKPVLACIWLTLLQGFSLMIGARYAAGQGGSSPSLILAIAKITAGEMPSWFWVIAYALVFPAVIWFVKAAVLNLIAELLGGPPRGMSLLAATAVACSPLLLVLPVALIAAWLSPDLNAGFVSHLWALFAWGVHVWWGVLTLVAVRETYRFTLSQAILTLLLPFVVGLPLAWIVYQVVRQALL